MIELGSVRIDPQVSEQFPDYVAVVMIIEGLEPGPVTSASEALLNEAEKSAIAAIGDGAAHDLAEILRWREAYASFGVKPRQARSSVESLMRRASSGLPRIDRITDTYNAVSVLHRVPIGGENLHAYVGPPQLIIAEGTEEFDTVSDGEPTTDIVPAGEIVWRDDAGVTCRRWNWRQCVRTRIGADTRSALFIIDSLGPQALGVAEQAGDVLIDRLSIDSPNLTVERLMLGK
jgi:DNA/RNA-binding domain of Phe-tRNA-synthetase-like protein